MKITRLFSLIAAAFLFTACGGDDSIGGLVTRDIVVPDVKELTQTVEADKTQGQSGVTFTTTAAWTSSIAQTRVDAPSWITITPDHGTAAGSYTISIKLDKNISGADRKATITIMCGESTITITIEQKGVEQVPVDQVKQVAKIYDGQIDDKPGVTVFQYDDQGRMVRITHYEGETLNGYTTLLYAENTITIYSMPGDRTEVYTLDSNGRGVSSRVPNEDYDSNTWRYDAQGYCTYWAQSYKLNPPVGSGLESIVKSDVNEFTWSEGNISKMLYYSDNDDSVWDYTFEYSTLQSNKVNIDISDLGENSMMRMLGYEGKRCKNFVSKRTISGDKWNKDNGTTMYRYVTDSDGCVTEIYTTFTKTGESPQAEVLNWKIEYK